MSHETSAKRQVQTIAMIGAGSFGTAVGAWLASNGHQVRIWDIDMSVINDLNAHHCNTRYLPDCPLPKNLVGFETLDTAMADCSIIVVAVPSRVFHIALTNVAQRLPSMDTAKTPILIWATKGFAHGTNNELLSEVADEILPDHVVKAVISGPSFAREVVVGLPSGYHLASKSESEIETIADVFRNQVSMVYTTDDMIGVQVGGATKNVIAIAAGISDGLGFGINARCLMITRGLAEMNRLNVALGGKTETMMGLSGLGDMVLTCSGDLSRNRRLGLGLGQGRKIDDVVAEIGQEIEGIQSARETYEIGTRHEVFMPITTEVYRILYEGKSPLDAARSLMAIGPTLQ